MAGFFNSHLMLFYLFFNTIYRIFIEVNVLCLQYIVAI